MHTYCLISLLYGNQCYDYNQFEFGKCNTMFAFQFVFLLNVLNSNVSSSILPLVTINICKVFISLKNISFDKSHDRSRI